MSKPTDPFDAAIVGAGPGGMAAAVTLAEAGRRVCVIDEAAHPGGQIWRNRGEPAKDQQARQWQERLRRVVNRLTFFRESRVVASPSARTLLLDTPDGPCGVGWDALILAVGARELFLPFPGWTLPGVIGAGGMQALVKQGLSVAGRRVVVAGTGPLLLAVADLLKQRGAIVPFILEQTSSLRLNKFALSLVQEPSKLIAAVAIRSRLLATDYATNAYPCGVTPLGSGFRVDYRRGQRAGSVECDYLACGFGLVPNNELPKTLGCDVDPGGFVKVDGHLRTTVPGIYAVGEVCGIGGVEKALLEGQLAACSAQNDASLIAPLIRKRVAMLRFARRLEQTFSLRPELLKLAKPSTVVCRCEDVQLGVIVHAFNGRDAKLQTRCGMGVCQGRVCGPMLQRLLGVEPPSVRPPVMVSSIGTLAAGLDVGASEV